MPVEIAPSHLAWRSLVWRTLRSNRGCELVESLRDASLISYACRSSGIVDPQWDHNPLNPIDVRPRFYWKLVNELQQHFSKINELLGIGLTHYDDFMSCFVSFISNSIDPLLTIWRHIVHLGQVVNVLLKRNTRGRSFVYCDVHEYFS